MKSKCIVVLSIIFDMLRQRSTHYKYHFNVVNTLFTCLYRTIRPKVEFYLHSRYALSVTVMRQNIIWKSIWQYRGKEWGGKSTAYSPLRGGASSSQYLPARPSGQRHLSQARGSWYPPCRHGGATTRQQPPTVWRQGVVYVRVWSTNVSLFTNYSFLFWMLWRSNSPCRLPSKKWSCRYIVSLTHIFIWAKIEVLLAHYLSWDWNLTGTVFQIDKFGIIKWDFHSLPHCHLVLGVFKWLNRLLFGIWTTLENTK